MEVYKAAPVGHEVSYVFYEVPEKFLTDGESMKEILVEGLKHFDFTIVGEPCMKIFPNGSYTMIIILSESHLAVHTYKEHNSLYIGMYSCRGPHDCDEMMMYFAYSVYAEEILRTTDSPIPVKKR